MSTPCPFCGFEASDYRESFNWHCTKCDKDYAAWLIAQKGNATSQESTVEKQPLFSRREIPSEAEPVKLAQSLFMLAMLTLLALNLVIEGIFSWVYPVSMSFAGYYAFTIHRTGYALGQHTVYERDRDPIIYNAFLWGSIAYIFVALFAWID